MPVTAALSKKLYEKLGDDVASQLVNWFNTVDAGCRADLRELNELNFARFDAKLEQRMAELDAKLERTKAELIKWMFTFWAPTALGVIATGFGVISLLIRN